MMRSRRSHLCGSSEALYYYHNVPRQLTATSLFSISLQTWVPIYRWSRRPSVLSLVLFRSRSNTSHPVHCTMTLPTAAVLIMSEMERVLILHPKWARIWWHYQYIVPCMTVALEQAARRYAHLTDQPSEMFQIATKFLLTPIWRQFRLTELWWWGAVCTARSILMIGWIRTSPSVMCAHRVSIMAVTRTWRPIDASCVHRKAIGLSAMMHYKLFFSYLVLFQSICSFISWKENVSART